MMTNPNLADYEQQAQQQLEPTIWHYLQDGCGAGLTLEANRRAYATRPLMPRPLVDVRGGHTQTQLFGQTLEHPILLAPIAYQRLFHPDGECASALAAAAQGTTMLVSSLASQSLESIAQASLSAGQAPWFQLYWQGERARTLRLAQRAIQAGYAVMVLTVDAPVKQASFRLPETITAVNLESPLTSAPLAAGQSAVFAGWMAQAPTWEEVAWLRQQLALPLLLKGILHPDDAEHAVALGCDGVIVSNHGGRVLDGTAASLDCLPAVVERVAAEVPVLFDGGIRSGREVYQALTLGARAVLLGRPAIWGLSAAGALGVAQVIRLMRDELELTMALCGTASVGP